MQTRLQLLLIISCLVLIFVLVDLIRRGRLRAEYSLVWLASIGLVLFLSIFRGSLRFLADLAQIDYPPSFIFMVGLGLALIIQLASSLTNSKMSRQNRDLAQKIAIQEWHLNQAIEAKERLEILVIQLLETTDRKSHSEEDMIDYEKSQTDGHRLGRSHLRFDNTLGQTREAADFGKTVEGGNSRRIGEHHSAYDRPGLDLDDDGQKPGQTRSV